MRRLSRSQLSILAVVVVGIVGLLVVAVPARPAEAQVTTWSEFPEWFQENAHDIVQGCVDMPADLLDYGQATVHTFAFQQAAVDGPSLAVPVVASGAGVGLAAGTTLTAPQAALAAGLGAGLFCGTIDVLDMIAPGSMGSHSITAGSIAIETVVVQCSLSYAEPTDTCFTVTRSNGTNFQVGTQLVTAVLPITDTGAVDTAGGVQSGPQFRSGDGTTSTTVDLDAHSDSNSFQVALACGSLGCPGIFNLAPLQWDARYDNHSPWAMALEILPKTPPYVVAGYDFATDHLVDDGWFNRSHVEVECRELNAGSLGDEYAVTSNSLAVLTGQTVSGWEHLTCDPGDIPLHITAQPEVYICGSACAWLPNGPPALDAPLISPEVLNNVDTRQCWVVGVTVCPMWDETPGDPNGTVRVGGQNGLQASKTATSTQTVARSLLALTPIPQDDPNPSPTTTVVASTTTISATTTTVAPPDETVPPKDPPGPPGPPDPGDNQWSTCMDSQVGDDWSEVTYNPITWVRAIIYYVTAPIICALWWLVVPPDGFGSLLDLFTDELADLAVVDVFTSTVEAFQWNGGCAPVQFGDPLGDMGPTLGAIDVGMCGNLVIALAWTVLLALAVIGMASDLIRTLWTFGELQKVKLA